MSDRSGVKTHRPIPTAVAGTIVLVLMCASTSWADTEEERESLRGLLGVQVVVENLSSDVERDGLSREQIQTDVELRLRQSRIPVLTKEERLRTPGSPWLYVHVSTFKHTEYPMYAVTVNVGLTQQVLLARKRAGTPISAETWRATGSNGIVGTARVREMRQGVLDEVDAFINAYLAVNPR